jgi:carboxypeptidase Q
MKRLPIAGVLIVIALLAVRAEERVDQDVFWKIRQEATNNSQILRTLHVLTDVYGPRLTGSPNLKNAGEWAVQQMHSWGLRNGHLEPWDFGHSGWLNERLSAHIVAPVKDALVVEALSWTPGTRGAVHGAALQIELPQRPTAAELNAYFDRIKDSIKGKIVLVGAARQVPVSFNAPAMRRDDAEITTQLNAAPAAGRGGGGQNAAPVELASLTANQVEERLMPFLAASGVLVRVNDAARAAGQIRAFNNRLYDVAKAPPTVVMRNEDYGRISRLLADGRGVELEFDIVNHVYPEGRTSYNVVAEIPGSDKADEVVMLGGHLDSWHAATGATDNAIGCAVMMEAARILSAIGVKPRRTIRVALWSGEEQGLLGSQAYVKEHFGTFEQPKADYRRFVGYFNIDQGTGRARGLTVFGPPSAAAVLQETVASFKDLGVLGANTTRNRTRGGSDHTSFNEAGLPGIWVMQDPIQYDAQTWHSNLDTYERIVEDDVKKSAIVIAAAVYHLAMREERLPMFSAGEMPSPPARPPATPAPPAATPTSN